MSLRRYLAMSLLPSSTFSLGLASLASTFRSADSPVRRSHQIAKVAAVSRRRSPNSLTQSRHTKHTSIRVSEQLFRGPNLRRAWEANPDTYRFSKSPAKHKTDTKNTKNKKLSVRSFEKTRRGSRRNLETSFEELLCSVKDDGLLRHFQARFPACACAAKGLKLGMPQIERESKSVSSRTAMGFVSYCFGIQQRAFTEGGRAPDFRDPLTVLKHVKEIGGGGLQMDLGVREANYLRELRNFAESNHLFVEGSVALPRSDSDLAKFEQQIVTAREAGAQIVRTVILSGRRYEQFHNYNDFKTAMDAGEKALRRAEPVMARHKLKLAVENHKDQRIDERVKLLNSLSSEHIGACFDVGNNIALLEDPMTVAKALAPWIVTVHFKDQGVREYEGGFLLADTPLGTGCIDLTEVVKFLGEKCPKARLTLELITRDALKVPILSGDYWSTMADVPASDLANTMSLLKQRATKEPFQKISSLPLEEQIRIERSNVEQSVRYAIEQLKI
jgi:sugar phosphate isomerase/epimerase